MHTPRIKFTSLTLIILAVQEVKLRKRRKDQGLALDQKSVTDVDHHLDTGDQDLDLAKRGIVQDQDADDQGIGQILDINTRGGDQDLGQNREDLVGGQDPDHIADHTEGLGPGHVGDHLAIGKYFNVQI